MHRGYIKLWRAIEDWPDYFAEKFTRAQAWIDLVMLANHKDASFRKRGNLVVLKRGQLAQSEEKLAERWKWGRGKVRAFLNELETGQQIVQQKSRLITVITIVNYEIYQETGQQIVQQTGQQTEQQIVQQYNNDKNVNNENKSPNGDSAKRFSPREIKSTFLPKEPHTMNEKIDESFPRKRRYGNEGLNWMLDYFEHRFGRKPEKGDAYNKRFILHLKREIGYEKLRAIIDLLSDVSNTNGNFWHDKLSGFAKIWFQREMFLTRLEEEAAKSEQLAAAEKNFT